MSGTADIFEVIRVHLPPYLSPQRQRDLFEELRQFPEKTNYYMAQPLSEREVLQGDGWRGFVAIDFRTSEQKKVSGLVLSNSCDIDQTNARHIPLPISFSPIVSLAKLEQRLSEGVSAGTRESFLSAIKRQEVTSMFYLPSFGDAIPESAALLGEIHGHPRDLFETAEKTLLFRLSQMGWYILLLKLSIHFSRMNEGIQR